MGVLFVVGFLGLGWLFWICWFARLLLLLPFGLEFGFFAFGFDGFRWFCWGCF